MRKIIFIVLLIISITPFMIYANADHVGPEISINGSIENQTLFHWMYQWQFTAYDEPVAVYQKNETSFQIIVPGGIIGKFYLSYKNNGQIGKIENQCRFTVNAISGGDVTITESDEPGAFISCHLTGAPSSNNLMIKLTSAIQNKLD